MATGADTPIAFVAGASGFVGKALIPKLIDSGYNVVGGSRNPPQTTPIKGLQWKQCDLLKPPTIRPALENAEVAYYLVHSMGGSGSHNYPDIEKQCAKTFVEAAKHAGVKRIVYLGGPEPDGKVSEHLKSRLDVGDIFRHSDVQTIELRASMIIGFGGASWLIVRDLVHKLPIMILPRWLRSKTEPVSIEDIVIALIGAAKVEVEQSQWFDVPGPEILDGRAILRRVAACQNRKIWALEVPVLSPELSSLWLQFVTRADYYLARELVMGLTGDLLAKNHDYWKLIGHTDLVTFDEAVRQALAEEKVRS